MSGRCRTEIKADGFESHNAVLGFHLAPNNIVLSMKNKTFEPDPCKPSLPHVTASTHTDGYFVIVLFCILKQSCVWGLSLISNSPTFISQVWDDGACTPSYQFLAVIFNVLAINIPSLASGVSLGQWLLIGNVRTKSELETAMWLFTCVHVPVPSGIEVTSRLTSEW